MNLGVVSSFALVSVSPLATDVQVGDICTLSTEHLYSTGAVSPGSVCQLGIGDTFHSIRSIPDDWATGGAVIAVSGRWARLDR